MKKNRQKTPWTQLLRIGLFLPAIILSTFVSGQVVLKNTTNDFSVTAQHAEIFEDSTNKLAYLDVKNQKFTRQEGTLLKNSNPRSTYWVRFKVQNISGKDKKWVLEAITPNLYTLEVWTPDASGEMKKHLAGLDKIKDKEYAHKNYVFDLPSGINSYEVYAKVWSPNVTGIEFKINSFKSFVGYALNEYYYLGVYYGILLIMLVYNLLVFATNKEKVYLFYALYLTSCMFLSLSEDGMGMQIIWKDYAHSNIHFTHFLSPTLFLISFVLYARSFLNLSKNFPLADKVSLLSALLYPAINLVQLLTEQTILFNLEDYYLVPFIIIFGASLYIYIKGNKSARFFILGYLVVFLCMIILQLRLHQIIESTVFTVYIFNFGIIMETIILSFALADRLSIIRKEKQEMDKKLMTQYKENSLLQKQLVQELQEKNELGLKVNRELEQKVGERTEKLQRKTQELEEANQKLDLYSQKLTEMNIQLDKDNWKLQKEVKQERTARIVHVEISYEEFIKSFPDKNACLRYLEELKWPDKFICRKCGNEKCNQKMFSRRCTSCDYIESPTSHTLFHGIKIPLNKAFYMIYAVNSKQKKMTIEEMSTMLDIGKNTCWDFQKKIKMRQEEKKKTLKVKEVESWDLLIMD